MEQKGQTEVIQPNDKSEQIMGISRPPSFCKIYATNVLVTTTDQDFRVELFNEKFKTNEGWVFQSEELVILTRQAAKQLQVMLNEKIKEYESQFGEIPVNEDRGKIRYLLR
ncbi:MAG: DUF3467 domain-containing protein [Dehalobacter sp.]|nr:DUF3467 domain-containing protein [Dehalobacter sp.]